MADTDRARKEEAVPDQEENFSPRIIDSLLNAVVIVDEQGRVLYANRAIQQLLGWRVDALFGEPFVNLTPERFRSTYTAAFERFVSADPPMPSYAPSRVVMLRAGGSEVPLDIGVFLVVPEVGQRLLIAVLWDLSDRVDFDRYQRVSDDLVAFLAGASGTTDVIVPQLLSIVATSMDFELATSWRWDVGTESLHCEHVWSKSDDEFPEMLAASSGLSVRAGEGLAGWVVSSDEPIWQVDLSRTVELRRHGAIMADGLQTAFLFPLRARNRFVGVIELFTKFQRGQDAPLNAAVADIGSKLGEFIERLDLEAERRELAVRLEQSHRQQEFLLRANRALAGARNFEESVQRLATVALPILGDICLIDVVGPTGTLERLAAVHADPLHQYEADELGKYSPDLDGPHPAARAVRTGHSQWSTEMGEEFMRTTTQGDRHFGLTRTLGFESYVSVPLLTEEVAIGALTVITAGSGRQFGKEELSLAESLALQVTSVIERTRAFDEQSSISHILQHSLLPDRIEGLAGIRVAARYEAASRGAEVGGDFYDVVPLDEHRLTLIIGDVQGHDMTAATVMGELRSAIRAYLSITHDPAGVLGLLNGHALTQSWGRFATTSIAVIDALEGTLEIASAGHPSPFLVGRDCPAEPLTLRPGILLGVSSAEYSVERLELPSAGALVFVTDGLIDEGRSDAGHRVHAFAELIDRQWTADPEELADAILALAHADSAGDDRALLVAQWSGPWPARTSGGA